MGEKIKSWHLMIKESLTVLPESGSAADVMIELGSVDGMKWVGKCPNIAMPDLLNPPMMASL
jgi:hypothetical protein